MGKLFYLPDDSAVEVPDDWDDATAEKAARKKFPELYPAKGQSGIAAAFMHGMRSIPQNFVTAGLGTFGDEETARKNYEAFQAREADKYNPASYEAAKEKFAAGENWEGIKGLLRYGGEQAAASMPYMAGYMGAARLGATPGMMMGNPAISAAGALLGAGAFGVSQFAGMNQQRQMEEGKPLDPAAAWGAAVPQTMLDVGTGFAVLKGFGFGKSMTEGVVKAMKGMGFGDGVIARLAGVGTQEAAEKVLLSAAKQSVTGAVARGVGKGVAFEVPTEVAQQVLERKQAGLDLLSPDAWKEYEQTAVGTVGPGAVFGGIGGAHGRMQGKGFESQKAYLDQRNERRRRFEAENARRPTPEHIAATTAAQIALKDQAAQFESPFDAGEAMSLAQEKIGFSPYERAMARFDELQQQAKQAGSLDDPAQREQLNEQLRSVESWLEAAREEAKKQGVKLPKRGAGEESLIEAGRNILGLRDEYNAANEEAKKLQANGDFENASDMNKKALKLRQEMQELEQEYPGAVQRAEQVNQREAAAAERERSIAALEKEYKGYATPMRQEQEALRGLTQERADAEAAPGYGPALTPEASQLLMSQKNAEQRLKNPFFTVYSHNWQKAADEEKNATARDEARKRLGIESRNIPQDKKAQYDALVKELKGTEKAKVQLGGLMVRQMRDDRRALNAGFLTQNLANNIGLELPDNVYRGPRVIRNEDGTARVATNATELDYAAEQPRLDLNDTLDAQQISKAVDAAVVKANDARMEAFEMYKRKGKKGEEVSWHEPNLETTDAKGTRFTQTGEALIQSEARFRILRQIQDKVSQARDKEAAPLQPQQAAFRGDKEQFRRETAVADISDDIDSLRKGEEDVIASDVDKRITGLVDTTAREVDYRRQENGQPALTLSEVQELGDEIRKILDPVLTEAVPTTPREAELRRQIAEAFRQNDMNRVEQLREELREYNPTMYEAMKAAGFKDAINRGMNKYERQSLQEKIGKIAYKYSYPRRAREKTRGGKPFELTPPQAETRRTPPVAKESPLGRSVVFDSSVTEAPADKIRAAERRVNAALAKTVRVGPRGVETLPSPAERGIEAQERLRGQRQLQSRLAISGNPQATLAALQAASTELGRGQTSQEVVDAANRVTGAVLANRTVPQEDVQALNDALRLMEQGRTSDEGPWPFPHMPKRGEQAELFTRPEYEEQATDREYGKWSAARAKALLAVANDETKSPEVRAQARESLQNVRAGQPPLYTSVKRASPVQFQQFHKWMLRLSNDALAKFSSAPQIAELRKQVADAQNKIAGIMNRMQAQQVRVKRADAIYGEWSQKFKQATQRLKGIEEELRTAKYGTLSAPKTGPQGEVLQEAAWGGESNLRALASQLAQARNDMLGAADVVRAVDTGYYVSGGYGHPLAEQAKAVEKVINNLQRKQAAVEELARRQEAQKNRAETTRGPKTAVVQPTKEEEARAGVEQRITQRPEGRKAEIVGRRTVETLRNKRGAPVGVVETTEDNAPLPYEIEQEEDLQAELEVYRDALKQALAEGDTEYANAIRAEIQKRTSPDRAIANLAKRRLDVMNQLRAAQRFVYAALKSDLPGQLREWRKRLNTAAKNLKERKDWNPATEREELNAQYADMVGRRRADMAEAKAQNAKAKKAAAEAADLEKQMLELDPTIELTPDEFKKNARYEGQTPAYDIYWKQIPTGERKAGGEEIAPPAQTTETKLGTIEAEKKVIAKKRKALKNARDAIRPLQDELSAITKRLSSLGYDVSARAPVSATQKANAEAHTYAKQAEVAEGRKPPSAAARRAARNAEANQQYGYTGAANAASQSSTKEKKAQQREIKKGQKAAATAERDFTAGMRKRDLVVEKVSEASAKLMADPEDAQIRVTDVSETGITHIKVGEGVDTRVRTVPLETPMPRSEAEDLFAAYDAILPDGVKKEYHYSWSTVPQQYKEQLTALGYNLSDVLGAVFPDGTILAVGETHASGTDLRTTLTHEHIGHHGVEAALGPKGMEALSNRVWKEGDAGVRELAKALRMEPAIVDAILDAPNKLNAHAKAKPDLGITPMSKAEAQMSVTRELIARVSEYKLPRVGKLPELVGRFIKWIAKAFRLFAPGYFDRVATTQDIYQALRDAMKVYSSGRVGPYVAPSRFPALSTAFIPTLGVTGRPNVTLGEFGRDLWQAITPYEKRNRSAFDKWGLGFVTQIVDSAAGLDQSIRRALAKQGKGVEDLRWGQTMWHVRSYQDVMHHVNDILSNGAKKLIAHRREDGGIEYTWGTGKEGRSGPSLRDVLRPLQGIDAPEHEVMQLATDYGIWRRGNPSNWKKVDMSILEGGDKGKEFFERVRKFEQWMKDPANEKTVNALKDWFEVYQDFNAGLVDMLVASQAIPSALGEELKRDRNYIPFYRINPGNTNSLEMWMGEKWKTIGDITHQPMLKALMGGEQKIMPFNVSVIRNVHIITEKAMGNLAAKTSAETLADLGLTVGGVQKGYGKPSDNVIRFNVEPSAEEWAEKPEEAGQRHVVIDTSSVDIPTNMVVHGLRGVTMQMPFAVKLLGKPGAWVRKFVTRNPMYAVRQLYSDLPTMMVVSGAPFSLFDAMRNLKTSLLHQNEHFARLQEMGQVGGNVFTGTQEDLERMVSQLARLDKGSMSFEKMMATLDRGAIAADAWSRATMFEALKRQGMSDMMASLASREALDFSRRGASPTMRALANLIPFFNTQVQALYAIVKSATGTNPFEQQLNVKSKFWKRGALLMAASLAYAMAMQDDKTYKNSSPYSRYYYWFVNLPGFDEPLRIRVPFEIGVLFKSIPQALYELAATDTTTKEAAKGLGMVMMNSNPFSIPPAFKAMIEQGFNVNTFTGGPLETTSMQRLATERRFGPRTTEISKVMSEALSQMGIGVSPVRLDALVNTFTSGTGLALLSMANPMINVMRSEPAGPVGTWTDRASELPIFGTAFQPNDSTGMINAAYDMANEFNEAAQTLKDLYKSGQKEKAEAFAKQYAKEIMLGREKGAANAFRKQMNNLKAKERQIRAASESAIPPDRKRALLEQIRAAQIALSTNFRSAVLRAGT